MFALFVNIFLVYGFRRFVYTFRSFVSAYVGLFVYLLALFIYLFLRLDKISMEISIPVLPSNDEHVGFVRRWRVRMGHPRCRRWGPDARKVSPRL